MLSLLIPSELLAMSTSTFIRKTLTDKNACALQILLLKTLLVKTFLVKTLLVKILVELLKIRKAGRFEKELVQNLSLL